MPRVSGAIAEASMSRGESSAIGAASVFEPRIETSLAQCGQHLILLFFAAHLQHEIDDRGAYRRATEGALMSYVDDVAVEFTEQLRQFAERAGHVFDLYPHAHQSVAANQPALQ